MARRTELTSADLARSAKELPLKTIKNLGYLLHTHLHNSGNWETVAEDLGYSYEAIKQFSTNANVRQDCTPGELMLRDWIGRGTGRTLFVLRNALYSSDRPESVEYLDQEINDKILHLDLHVCIADPDGSNVNYQPVRTKSDASLRESLQNVLDGPIRNYRIADGGASWDTTIAREFKGQELKLIRVNPTTNQEQDPTIDSSSSPVGFNCTGQCLQTSVNELDRPTRTEDVVCNNWNLNIPAEKMSNVSKAEPSQHCHSCTCQAGVQSSPNTVRKSMTIYDDQELTRQDLDQLARRPRAAKQGTNSSCAMLLSTKYQEPVSSCVIDSNSHTKNIHVESDAESLTFQKQLVETVQEETCHFSNALEMHLHARSLDSITKEKQLATFSRNMGNLVSYSDSSSGGEFEKGSLQLDSKDISCTKDNVEYGYGLIERVGMNTNTVVRNDVLKLRNSKQLGLNLGLKDDLTVYSYAQCMEDESTREENYNYAVSKSDGENDMDTQVVKLPQGTMSDFNEINFVNKDSMDSEQYCLQDDNSVAIAHLAEADHVRKCASKMDCQSLADISERVTFQDENAQFKSLIPCNTAGYRRTDVGLGMDSSEINNGIYTQQTDDTIFHVMHGSTGPKIDLADFVDDAAIHVVNVDKEDRSEILDIYASSVIPELEMAKPQICNSVLKTSAKDQGPLPYESLQRFLSCPNDFGYEEPTKQIKFQKVSENVEMPTIADSFTPVLEHKRFQDFLLKEENFAGQVSNPLDSNTPIAVNSLDRANRGKMKNRTESTPSRRSCTDVNRIRTNNDTRNSLFSKIDKSNDKRPLPALPTAESDLQSGHGQQRSRKSPPPLPPKTPKLSPHPYKLVSGGKTSRPMLDNLLTGDRLFIHFNNCLQGYPGWSPRETEYTVEKTLQSVIRSDGYYLLWYIRSRKRLALSISHLSKIVHYEIRTKVNNGKLVYYIFPDTVYPDVRLLLQHHESYGLRPQTKQEETGPMTSPTGRDSRRYAHVFMKCPVLVEYAPRQALSV